MGFGWALFATSTSRSHLPQEATPLPATVRPRRSSRPRRFDSPTGLAGLFHPAAAYRVPAPQGFVPLRGAAPGFPGRCPRAVAASASAVARAKTATTDFRALLPAVSTVASNNGLGHPTPRSPLGLAPPPGVPSPRHGSLRRLRPRSWPQRTRCVRPSASHWRGARLAWNQATDPHEVSGLKLHRALRLHGSRPTRQFQRRNLTVLFFSRPG
jgi:hypothetical protein